MYQSSRLTANLGICLGLSLLITLCVGVWASPAKSEDSPWTKVYPEGGTACLRGDPYAFWVKPGATDKLMIYFEGGGGCWDEKTCKPGSKFVHDRIAEEDGPAYKAGIFDAHRDENPFKDYTSVFIPYCTGDVHWGDKRVNYETEQADTPLQVHHYGAINASAALAWAYENATDPKSIVVAGCSAGSVGARVHAPEVIDHYPDAQVTTIGDSMTFVFPRSIPLGRQVTYSKRLTPELLTAGEFVDGENTSIDHIDRAVTSVYPNNLFAFYTGHQDPVQELFYKAFGGTEAEFRNDFDTHLTNLAATAPNFRTFVSSSPTHCTFREEEFYTLTEQGVFLRDWVATLAEHKPVENVACPSCFKGEE